MIKLKNIASATVRTASNAWNWLSGKKRRIAVLSGAVMQIAKPHTVAYQIANAAFWLFGGADATESGSKFIKEKLPSGLRK